MLIPCYNKVTLRGFYHYKDFLKVYPYFDRNGVEHRFAVFSLMYKGEGGQGGRGKMFCYSAKTFDEKVVKLLEHLKNDTFIELHGFLESHKGMYIKVSQIFVLGNEGFVQYATAENTTTDTDNDSQKDEVENEIDKEFSELQKTKSQNSEEEIDESREQILENKRNAMKIKHQLGIPLVESSDVGEVIDGIFNTEAIDIELEKQIAKYSDIIESNNDEDEESYSPVTRKIGIKEPDSRNKENDDEEEDEGNDGDDDENVYLDANSLYQKYRTSQNQGKTKEIDKNEEDDEEDDIEEIIGPFRDMNKKQQSQTQSPIGRPIIRDVKSYENGRVSTVSPSLSRQDREMERERLKRKFATDEGNESENQTSKRTASSWGELQKQILKDTKETEEDNEDFSEHSASTNSRKSSKRVSTSRLLKQQGKR